MTAFAVRTVVIQSFRNDNVADWLARCLDSVRRWSQQQGHDYAFYSDEFFELCGPEYLARVQGNPRSITNLARLEATRRKLAEGYDQVIWLDADVFIFDAARFTLHTEAPYAFGLEVWVTAGKYGEAIVGKPSVHNAAFLFRQHHPDLDLFIHIIRHTVMTRPLRSNLQVGVRLISGLAYTLQIPVMTPVGMFSPDVIKMVAAGTNRQFLRGYARGHSRPIQAANLCWSLQHEMPEPVVGAAMDRLESSAGDIINQHLL